ncbi:MAG: HipA family kinase [Pseudomonadota bacterium]|nr:HipA family kinase [Pseudomonadota bacterium]
MTIEITEVIRRSIQGTTRPFLCSASDGQNYYVKGWGAGKESLIFEWMAGSLAVAVGLPVPQFEVAVVPPEIVDSDLDEELSDLGSGPVFASLAVQQPIEITESYKASVPTELRQMVLVFDWWVRNEDRTLQNDIRNPNLLIASGSGALVVFDHNCAFDATFNEEAFFENHVFAEDAKTIFSDMMTRAHYQSLFAAALSRWPVFLDSLPEPWLYADKEMSVPLAVDLDGIFSELEERLQDRYWVMP